MLFLIVGTLAKAAHEHGRVSELPKPESFWDTLASIGIVFMLLVWGGFFSS